MPVDHVGKLAQSLHDAKILNLDTKIGDVLKVQGIGELGPGGINMNNAVAWDSFVVVTKGIPAGINELQQLAASKANKI